MKKVLKPIEHEEAVYYSDFAGKCFGKFQPEAVLSLDFYYGSKYDDQKVTLHLSDEEAEAVMDFIKSKISEDYKASLREKLYDQNENLENSIGARDYNQSDYYINSCNLLRFLLK